MAETPLKENSLSDLFLQTHPQIPSLRPHLRGFGQENMAAQHNQTLSVKIRASSSLNSKKASKTGMNVSKGKNFPEIASEGLELDTELQD